MSLFGGSTVHLYSGDNMMKQFFAIPVLSHAFSMLLVACGESEDDEAMHVNGLISRLTEKR